MFGVDSNHKSREPYCSYGREHENLPGNYGLSAIYRYDNHLLHHVLGLSSDETHYPYLRCGQYIKMARDLHHNMRIYRHKQREPQSSIYGIEHEQKHLSEIYDLHAILFDIVFWILGYLGLLTPCFSNYVLKRDIVLPIRDLLSVSGVCRCYVFHSLVENRLGQIPFCAFAKQLWTCEKSLRSPSVGREHIEQTPCCEDKEEQRHILSKLPVYLFGTIWSHLLVM